MKTFIFGIDGLDKSILIKYKDDLPNFSAIFEKSPDTTLRSVYPPDSHTAWASIYTGQNPAQHGIIDFVDPLEKTKILSEGDIDNSAIKGNTFWDILGNRGKKVCIVFPHLGYPAWKVNGVMVGRSSFKDDISIYPECLKDKYDFSGLGVLKGFPEKSDLDDYILQAKELIRREYKFTTLLMRDIDWDLAFAYSPTIDWIEHYFWNYFEGDDGNKYKNVILDFYKEYDHILGLYSEQLKDVRMIILSDHGHGARPKNVVNLNEVLRQKGFLKSNIKINRVYDPFYLYEKIKINVVDLVVTFNLGKIAQKVLVKFPRFRKIYTSPISINWKDSLAYISDLSGIKAYSYGGIRIVRNNINTKDYEELRDRLIKDLLILRDPKTNEGLFKWIKKREDLYHGQFIDKYPDLIFDLRDGYGAGWNLCSNLVTNASSSNLVPGSHKIDTAVLLITNLDKKLIIQDVTLMDIALIIIDVLETK